jgi:hypothetical protein
MIRNLAMKSASELNKASEHFVIISANGEGFAKYASSDPIHAAKFQAHWGGTLYRIKESNIEIAKAKALAAWRSGHTRVL